MSTPLPEGQQGAKAEALTDKIAINQTAWDSTAVSLALEEITIISGTKRNLVQVEWGIRKYFIIRKRLKVLLMKMIKLTDSEKQML
jgi:hypothetical protein